jgi:hypothetical protein
LQYILLDRVRNSLWHNHRIYFFSFQWPAFRNRTLTLTVIYICSILKSTYRYK